MSLSKIWILTILLSKMVIKQKTTPIILLIGTLSIITSSAISGIDIGDKNNRLFVDATIFIQSSILTLISIFFALNYLERERRGGVFIVPLSSGIGRDIYFIAIINSQILILTLIFILFATIDLIFITIFKIDMIIIYQLFLAFLSSTILATLVISIGQYASPLKALIYSTLIYFIGNSLDELFIYSYQLKPDENLQTLYQILVTIFPNFYIFDSKNISFQPLFHTLIQITLLSALGYFQFKRKILKVEN